jgi:sugar lactone lactonase YvrE
VKRRQFIGNSLLGLVGLSCLPMASCGKQRAATLSSMADRMVFDSQLNVFHPEGTALRIVARSGEPVAGGSYLWHGAPDGGACFASDDGGWCYVSNSELPDRVFRQDTGGVGVLRFDPQGKLLDGYSILQNTYRNCAGGKTPWNTWLSCEEYGDVGLVYECDPYGKHPALARPAMGAFNHEAVAVDPLNKQLYLTEDRGNGALYRFTPTTWGDLSEGLLEVGVDDGNRLGWVEVPDPSGESRPTRLQVKGTREFAGGEGIVYYDGKVFFTTKGDDHVWQYDIDSRVVTAVYQPGEMAVLTGVDNIEVSQDGTLIVAEDGGDMQLVALDLDYQPVPLVAIMGQPGSEVTGPAFSPDGSRLYFSSQRGVAGRSDDGITYELAFL